MCQIPRCEYLHKKGVHYCIENPMSTLLWTYRPMEACCMHIKRATSHDKRIHAWSMPVLVIWTSRFAAMLPGHAEEAQLQIDQRSIGRLWCKEWDAFLHQDHNPPTDKMGFIVTFMSVSLAKTSGLYEWYGNKALISVFDFLLRCYLYIVYFTLKIQAI